MTTHFDLVILIDCWELSDVWLEEEHHKEMHEFYERIVNRLGEYDFKNVALAGYSRPTDGSRETDAWLVDNIHSRNHGDDLKVRKCEDIVQLFREYPEALHTGYGEDPVKKRPRSFNVLICGQSWQVCTHWRPLGIINWLLQEQTVFTHPDLVWHSGEPVFDGFVFEDDPRVEWHKVGYRGHTAHQIGVGGEDIESPCFYAKKLKWDHANEVPPASLYHRRET